MPVAGHTAQVHRGDQSAARPLGAIQARLLMTTSQTEKGSSPKISDEDVASTDYKGWSPYGAPWLQPVAISGKSNRRGNGKNKPKPLPAVATHCRLERMVRRGSTVRVRQRALQKRRKAALFSFTKTCTISSVRWVWSR